MISDDDNHNDFETKIEFLEWETISYEEEEENGNDDDWELVGETKQKDSSELSLAIKKTKHITADVDEANYNKDLIKKADGGDAVAMCKVGIGYRFGKYGFPKDLKKAHMWFEKSHTAGYIPATASMASHLIAGTGVAKNKTLGLTYISMAAQGGVDIAAYNLGKGFARGLWGLKVDKVEAIKWLNVALSGECQFQKMSDTHKQNAQDLLDKLMGSGGSDVEPTSS